MALTVDEIVLTITFFIIFGGFLAYDLFKRGEKYGALAYVVALLPANYMWYLATKNGNNLDFGVAGSMMVLALMWIVCVIRDIAIKNKEKGFKDADDVALMLIIGIIIQLILCAVIPGIPGNEAMQQGTATVLSFFYVVDPFVANPTPGMLAYINGYRIVATILTISIIIPIILDLRGSRVTFVAIFIITLVFALPFAYLAFIWVAGGSIAIFILFCVLLFFVLLGITKGRNQ